MIVVVDYEVGNLGSIVNMLKRIGQPAQVSADPVVIERASKLLLPGVGAFDAGMDKLDRSGLVPVLRQRVLFDKVPTLGICLGMHLMTRCSEEGVRSGLGWVDAETLRFRPADTTLKVPHMGWNRVMPTRQSPLTDELPEEPRFYFVHSFYVRCANDTDVLLTTSFGDSFTSAFQHGNVWGVQFHPEKSHKFGMALLRNFATKVH